MPATQNPKKTRMTTVETLKLLTVVLVVGGTIVASWVLYEKSVTYQARANEHARLAAEHEANRSSLYSTGIDHDVRKAEYHSRMNQKWEDAAYHPWLPVEPDPPFRK